MKRVFIETQNVLRFNNAMRILLDTEKGNPGLGVVYGLAGRGKTWACKKYAFGNENVLYVRVLEGWTQRAMLAHLCIQLGLREHNTLERCRQEIIKFLDSRNVCIVMDEADRLHHTHVEHLRDLHDISGCVVVFVGEQQLRHLLEAKRRIWSRVTQVVEFGPVTVEDIVLFAHKASGLRLEPAAAEKIASVTQGDFRRVYHVVRDLERFARANRIGEITEDVLGHIEIITSKLSLRKLKVGG